MIATLRLEAIGDACAALGRALQRGRIPHLPKLPPYKAAFVYDRGRRPWVARIASMSHGGSLTRLFVDPNKDYREANKNGDRGVYCTFVLRSGNVYEVHELLNWTKRRRYFCAVEANGDVKEITLEDVARRLSSSTTRVAMQGIIDQAAVAK